MIFAKYVADKIIELKGKYPEARSALLPALQIVQEEAGYVNEEGVKWLAKLFDLSPVEVAEVATFYSMLHPKPVGKYHIQICRTLSCSLCGSAKLKDLLEKRFSLAPFEVSADGNWSYEEVECLGACGGAPAMMINDVLFENLTIEKFEQIIRRIEKERPTLRFSTKRGTLGTTLRGFKLSEINSQRQGE